MIAWNGCEKGVEGFFSSYESEDLINMISFVNVEIDILEDDVKRYYKKE